MGLWADIFKQTCKPRSRLTGSQWADRYRSIPAGTSPEPGEWRTDRTPYLREVIDSATDKLTETVVFCASSQVGKALALDTPLPTPTGWTTMGALKLGDELFDENGNVCRVTMKTDVMRNHRCYRVRFSDGSEIVADAGHKWAVDADVMHFENGKPTQHKGCRHLVMTTEEMKVVHDECQRRFRRNTFAIPVAKPLALARCDLPVKPYTLGVWLGDGHSYSNQFCGYEDDIGIVEGIRADGYRVDVRPPHKKSKSYIAVIDPKVEHPGECSRGHRLAEVGTTKRGYCAECARQYGRKYGRKVRVAELFDLDPIVHRPGILSTLNKMGVLKNKHIPGEYLRASEPQRWALLQGLMDTDGHATPKGLCEITLKSKALILGVKELLLSLGLKPTLHEKRATIKSRGFECTVYRLTFTAYSDQPVFRLSRKQSRLKDRSEGRVSETTRRRIVAIDSVESVPVQCITVDSPSHLFLAGSEMIPTHNSEALLCILGYFADQEPAPQLMLQPTVEMAEAFSKERIEPMFQVSVGLQGKLEEGKEGRGSAKKSSTTIRMKHYQGGYLALVGANSPAGLASRPIRVLLCDEVDRYGETKEGDPLKLAIQRTQNFGNRKIIIVSTPTIKGASKIDDWYQKSDKREFYVTCPHCGEEHTLKWDYVRWDKDADGNALPMTAAMYCPECGAKERGPYKPDLNVLTTGKWKATHPGRRIKGYHINALYSPWVNLHDLVEEFVSVNKDHDRRGLMEFKNLKLGEVWEVRNLEEDKWAQLYARREVYPEDGSLPEGVLALTAGVDVQHDRLECSVYGWGVGKECWGIEHRVIYGQPDDPKTWQQLDAVLTHQYSLANGVNIKISCMFVDSGDGSYTNDVYRYTKARERLGVFSIKGRGGLAVPLTSTPTKNNSMKAMLFTLGVDSGKSLVMNGLDTEEPGPGYAHFAAQEDRGFTEGFFKQLTSEVFENVFDRDKGTRKMAWKKIRERNEALDCAVYATAAMELLRLDFEYLAKFYENGGVVKQQTAPRRPRGTLSKGITL